MHKDPAETDSKEEAVTESPEYSLKEGQEN